jgi:hypothetical protein
MDKLPPELERLNTVLDFILDKHKDGEDIYSTVHAVCKRSVIRMVDSFINNVNDRLSRCRSNQETLVIRTVALNFSLGCLVSILRSSDTENLDKAISCIKSVLDDTAKLCKEKETEELAND